MYLKTNGHVQLIQRRGAPKKLLSYRLSLVLPYKAPHLSKSVCAEMEIRVPTLPSPCHYASASLSPLPSLGSLQFFSHGTSLVKPLSSSSSHWRATPITSRRSPLLVRFSAIDTPAELQSNLKVRNSIQYTAVCFQLDA